jgi:ribosomal protein L7/L12
MSKDSAEFTLDKATRQKLHKLLKNNPNFGDKVMAVKLVQDTTKCGLSNAKAYIDAMIAEL